ncbi:MAG: 4Fe-4S binding protein [Myxococcaceae bacterium]
MAAPSLSAPAVAARERLQSADLKLQRTPRYQRLRRATLALSVLWVVGLPLWHLSKDLSESAGLGGGGRWALLAGYLPDPPAPPFLGAPWTVSLFGLELLDPTAFLSLLAARAVDFKVVLGALPLLVLVALLGRFFCGWLCPYLPVLAASNALRALLARVGIRAPDLRLPRWTSYAVLAGLLAATAIAQTHFISLVYPPAVIGRELYRAIFQGAVGAGATFILGAFLFDTFVSRAGFCRSLCPGGATFSLLSLRSPVKVKREALACTDCTVCDVVCNLGQQPMTDRVDEGCERCGKCIAVCPTGALRFELGSGKRKGAG